MEVSSSSEKEPSGKAHQKKYSLLKKKVIGLKESFRKLKESVMDDLSKINKNLR